MAGKNRSSNKGDEGLIGVFAALIIFGFLVSFFGYGGNNSSSKAKSATQTPPAKTTATTAASPAPQNAPSGLLYAPTTTKPRTKSDNCRVYKGRPDYQCTPGAITLRINQNNIQNTICQTNYLKSSARPSTKKVQAAFAEYKIKKRQNYRLDHLIPLHLGGSNDIANLWPQPKANKRQPAGVQQKNKMESRLLSSVCSGKITLAQAQSTLAIDWLAYYNSYVKGLK